MTFAIEDDIRDVMALMIVGAWLTKPLSPVEGVHLGRCAVRLSGRRLPTYASYPL